MVLVNPPSIDGVHVETDSEIVSGALGVTSSGQRRNPVAEIFAQQIHAL